MSTLLFYQKKVYKEAGDRYPVLNSVIFCIELFSKIIKFQNKQLTYFVEMDVAAWFMGKTLNCA